MTDEPLQQLIANVLRPIIEADGGEIELCSVSDEEVVLQLSGACAACPGFGWTKEKLVVPLIRKTCGANVEVVVLNTRMTESRRNSTSSHAATNPAPRRPTRASEIAPLK